MTRNDEACINYLILIEQLIYTQVRYNVTNGQRKDHIEDLRREVYGYRDPRD
jgi:hypothetical protein